MQKKFLFVLIAAFMASSVAMAQEVTLPDKIEVRPGRLVRIDAKTTSKEVVWIKPLAADIDFIPIASENSVIFLSTNPGTYRIIAIVAKGDKPYFATCDVTVIGAIPPPPPPPPPPPIPIPDAFTGKVVDAWKVSSDADKAKTKQYQAWFSELAMTISGENGKAFKTVGDLRKTMTTSRKNLIGDSLRAVATVIGDDMNATLPHTDEVVMDDALRARFAIAFMKYSKALDYCK